MKCLLRCVIFLLAVSCIMAQDDVDKIKSKLPHLLGANNAGNEFFLTFHPSWEESSANNFIKVFVSSAFSTEVRLTIPAISKTPYMVKQLQPYEVIDFNLPPEVAQCYSRGTGGNMQPLPSQVFAGKGIIVESDAPIVCYGVSRFIYTSDGFLALPTNVLGKQYKVAAYTQTTDGKNQYLNGYTSIVGVHDNTVVNFTLHGNAATYITDEKGENHRPGETITREINRGDVWLIAGMGPFNDISESLVTGNKPFAVISGNHCVYIPKDLAACNYTIEQEIPIETWGVKYHVPPIFPRKVSPIIRIFPTAEKTKIYRNGSMFAELLPPAAPGMANFLECRTADDKISAKPALISADSPVGIMLYNTGQQDDGIPSDPFQMVLTPIHQYTKNILFNTPGIKGGVGFSQNYLIVVYLADAAGNIPEDLVLGQKNGDEISWQKVACISSVDRGSFNDFDPETNREYKYVTIQLPGDGIYMLNSDTPFAAYSYGFSDYDSYGFPAAVVLLPDRETGPGKVNAPTITSNDGADGSVQGSATGSSLTSGKSADISLACMISSESSNYEFKADKPNPENMASINWSLQVKDAGKEAKAVLLVSDRMGRDTIAIFRYVPVGIEEKPAPDKYITVFPMPVRDNSALLYECREAGTADIELFDVSGKLVRTIARAAYIDKGTLRLAISANGLDAGAYTLRIVKNGEIESKMIIIE